MMSFNESRRLGIGGSDVAAIMGLSPWKTACDIYFEKVQGNTTPDNKNLARGRKLEKYILEEYSDQHEVELDTSLPFIQSKELPYLIGNIDARVKGENVLVEAKSAGCHPSQWKDDLPIYYRTQVAHYAMISDCDRVDIPVMFDRWTYACFSYQRDPFFEKSIKEACVRFWEENVLKTTPPEPRSVENARSMYQISKEATLPANQEIKESLEKIKKIEDVISKLSKQEDEHKLRIMLAMKDHQAFIDEDGKELVTWKSQTTNRLDTASLKKMYPAIYQEFSKNSSSRVFRIKGERNDHKC